MRPFAPSTWAPLGARPVLVVDLVLTSLEGTSPDATSESSRASPTLGRGVRFGHRWPAGCTEAGPGSGAVPSARRARWGPPRRCAFSCWQRTRQRGGPVQPHQRARWLHRHGVDEHDDHQQHPPVPERRRPLRRRLQPADPGAAPAGPGRAGPAAGSGPERLRADGLPAGHAGARPRVQQRVPDAGRGVRPVLPPGLPPPEAKGERRGDRRGGALSRRFSGVATARSRPGAHPRPGRRTGGRSGAMPAVRHSG